MTLTINLVFNFMSVKCYNAKIRKRWFSWNLRVCRNICFWLLQRLKCFSKTNPEIKYGTSTNWRTEDRMVSSKVAEAEIFWLQWWIRLQNLDLTFPVEKKKHRILIRPAWPLKWLHVSNPMTSIGSHGTVIVSFSNFGKKNLSFLCETSEVQS